MKYTINGKEYTEFDINKRCAELMNGHPVLFQPCTNPHDAWPIIDKCFNFLVSRNCEEVLQSRWEFLVEKHTCSKLVAACICFIEIKEGE